MKEYYKIISSECTRSPLVQPLPEKSKPLCANVKSVNGECAVCASFYHPVQHAWIVHFATLPENYVEPVKVTLRVVVLLDADGRYEISIVASSLVDGALPLEIEQLHRLSAVLTRRLQAQREQLFASSLTSNQEKSSIGHNLVSLITRLPSSSPCVLCGGGFYSIYPVVKSIPTKTATVDSKVNDRYNNDEYNAESENSLEPSVTSDLSLMQSCKCSTSFNSYIDVCGLHCNNIQCNAWSVTAPPHAELMCFVIALRRRHSVEWMQRRTNSSFLYSPAAESSILNNMLESHHVDYFAQVKTDDLPHRHIDILSRNTLHQENNNNNNDNKITYSNATEDDDFWVTAKEYNNKRQQVWQSAEDYMEEYFTRKSNEHQKLESTVLQQGISISLSEKSCRWSIALPEPHKAFSVRWSPNYTAGTRVINTFFK